MNSNRKVILYIAMSLDGYIARQDGDIGWLSLVEQTVEDYGYSDFMAAVDTVILGRKTYDKVFSFGIGFPHADKECYVITRSEIPSKEKITFYNKDLKELITTLKGKTGKNIFVDGGAEIVNELMKNNLIDEYIISIIPIMLGNGIRLFNNTRPENNLQLIDCKKFDSSLVQIHYITIK